MPEEHLEYLEPSNLSDLGLGYADAILEWCGFSPRAEEWLDVGF